MSEAAESINDVVVGLWKTWLGGFIALVLAAAIFFSNVGDKAFFAGMLVVLAAITIGRGLWNLKKERARIEASGTRSGGTGGVERLGRNEGDED